MVHGHGAKAWLSSTIHPNYHAASEAAFMVLRLISREKEDRFPLTPAFENRTQMNVLLLPVGTCDDMVHSQNEKFIKSNLINAIKVWGCYLHELGKIKGPKPSL